MKLTLKAKSSSFDGFYLVNFVYDGGLLSVFCSCPAGKSGKFCKHKWQLLSGNTEMLYDPTESEVLQAVHRWALGRNYEQLYKKVNEFNEQIEKLQKEISDEKRQVERKFREGF